MSDLYRDYIDGKADEIINSLGGTITPAPANAELYRDFLDRKFDDVINAVDGVKVKSFTYKGTGTIPRSITFPTTPKIVLGIYRYYGSNYTYLSPFMWGFGYAVNSVGPVSLSASISTRTTALTYNGNELTLEGETADRSMNINNIDYTVYYI